MNRRLDTVNLVVLAALAMVAALVFAVVYTHISPATTTNRCDVLMLSEDPC